jgi:hypothetical protein
MKALSLSCTIALSVCAVLSYQQNQIMLMGVCIFLAITYGIGFISQIKTNN